MATDTENGLSFPDTIGGLFTAIGQAGQGVAQAVQAFNPPKVQQVYQPVYTQQQPAPAPAGSSGFKLDAQTMMLLAAVGIVVLVVAVK